MNPVESIRPGLTASAAVRGLALGLALAAVAASAGAAQERARGGWMPADAIRREFTGRLLNGIYPNASEWSEHLFANGTTDYREGTIRWAGRWWTEDRSFCFVYPPPGVGGCFRVVRLGSNCYELYETGSAIGRGDARPDDTDLWNGRMWLAERQATCDERPTS
jgi:hypothetical protein